ncbi:BH0509 family protein [Ferdinandcohnia sp. Marseille-Q9671]
MSRQERKNMIEFIEKVKGFDKISLMYMTDADIEHIYNTTYFHFEEIAE